MKFSIRHVFDVSAITQCLAIRRQVFVEEQQIPLEMEKNISSCTKSQR